MPLVLLVLRWVLLLVQMGLRCKRLPGPHWQQGRYP